MKKISKARRKNGRYPLISLFSCLVEKPVYLNNPYLIPFFGFPSLYYLPNKVTKQGHTADALYFTKLVR